MPTRFTDGTVTVELDDGLDAFARSLLDAAERESIALMEAAAAEVAADATRDWYRQVQRRTGASGDLAVVTTLDSARGEVRVSVGSTDVRRQGSKPVAALVHRPGPLSQVRREITRSEYESEKKRGRSKSVVHSRDGGYYRFEKNPKASDGKVLVVELVRKPLMKKLKTLTPAIAEAIARRLGGA